MNVEKLKRVAIKEFTRSPAKTGFLLTMVPVALYFCIPPLFGAVKKSSPSASAHGEQDVSKTADFVLPGLAAKGVVQSRTQQGWVEVAARLDSDLLTIPARSPLGERNPFAAIGQTEEDESLAAVDDDGQVEPLEIEQKALEEFVDQPLVEINPIRGLGLQLNVTMIGQRSKLATINGKTYEEGETIPVIIEIGTAAKEAATMQLQLSHVDRRFVVLEMGGHQHRLQLRQGIPQDAIVVKPRSE